MTSSTTRLLVRGGAAAMAGLVLILLAGGADAKTTAKTTGARQRVNTTAAAEADFLKRVHDYVDLQKKLEAMLPKLPDKATPQQIDQNQRALGDLVSQARATAKPGDLF